MAVRDKEVGLRGAQVKALSRLLSNDKTYSSCRCTHFLADTVRPINEAPYAFFLANLHELLPRQDHTWIRGDRVDPSDDLVALQVVRPRCIGRGIAVVDVRIRVFDIADLRTETVDDLCMRHGEGEYDARRRGPRRLGAAAEVANRARDGVLRRRSCMREARETSLVYRTK